MHRFALSSVLLLALAASFLIAAPAALAEVPSESPQNSLQVVLVDAPLFLLQSPETQALFQCSQWQADAETASETGEVTAFGSCSESITCPGSSSIPPHNISCHGSYSCDVKYNPGGSACAVICDGMARECFPNGCF